MIENNLTFENAIEELQKIVESLENGKAPLDDSLTLFERGVELVKFCNSKLDEATQKVTFLTENGDNDD